MASSSKNCDSTKSTKINDEYVKDYTEKEVEEYLKFIDYLKNNRRECEYNAASEDEQKLYTADLAKAYQECHFTYKQKSNLPILSMKNSILSMIETNAVVVIQGPTGCGKTTQIPQLILDSNIKKRLHCNIIVTQPRRIAAISIANRVSQEGGWPLGNLVGYRVGMMRQISHETRLTYCTTEVLLQQLINQKHMLNYTHVILDEIHERDQELDFLLLVIKKLLKTNSKLVKVILMSATIDTTRIAKYFSTRVGNKLVPAPIIKIPEKKLFETHVYYLDEIKDLGIMPEVFPSEPKVTPAMVNFCTKIIVALDQIDINDNDRNVIGRHTNSFPQRHTVLIFLPGIYEIEELYTYLSSEYHKNKLWDLAVLHSLISSDEQQRVFYKPPPNYRRIILSTNIAESSITVPDVKYVIDFCLLKVLTMDSNTNYQSLQLCWASKTNCLQRAGRAGRVMDGRVYRLVPYEFYYNILDDEGTPEMLRAPLANVVLRAKILDFDNPRSLLALSLDPPSVQNLSSTILTLKEIGALTEDDDMAFDEKRFDGKLTDLGRIMAFLPLEIHISKLIVLGHVFGILQDAVILGASMAVKDIFTNNQCRSSISSYTIKKKWAHETDSDCIASLNVYKTWQNEKANRRLVSYQAERQWAQRHGVQLRTLRELDALVNDITDRLKKLGIKQTVGVNKVVWENWDCDFVLQVILAGAFYPNYFVKRPKHIEVYKDSMMRDLGALNPMRTVFLRGWPMKQPGYLYAQKLQEIFSQHQGIAEKQIMISFNGSKRVYVQFREKEVLPNDETLYKISDFVYKAIKMRHCNIPVEIRLLNVKQAQERSKDQNLNRFEQTIFFNKNQKRISNSPRIRSKLPSLDVTFVPLFIKKIYSPGYFWAIIDNENTRKEISSIKAALNTQSLREFRSRPEISTLVAAPVEENGSLTYHRAIIENYTSEVANIFFIDHGYSSQVRLSDLRLIDDITIASLPSLAFRCTLVFLRPLNQTGNLQRRWSKISQNCLKRQIHESEKVFGKIYSVVESIVNLELITVNKNGDHFNINEYLVEEGYAVKGEESYLSQYNHDLRADINIVMTMSPEEKLFYEERQYNEDSPLEYPEPPKEEECDSKIKLEGPFSPLEIELMHLTAVGKSKKITIDDNSINSVLLDENPDGPTRLLVAQTVNQTVNNNHLNLRNTTLLPNIRGLAALLALIFAPHIELRRNFLGTYYTGALCGLGPMNDCTENAIFPDHDMKILFDVQISIDDLREINKLRYWMNIGIQLQHEDPNDDNNERMINCQNRIKHALLELRDRCRKSQNPTEDNEFNKWNRYDTSMFLSPARGVRKDEIYSLHKALELQERNDELEEMVTHLVELYRLVNDDIRKAGNVDAFCKLCKMQTFGLLNLRGHLYSEQHVKNEQIMQIPNIRGYYYYY